MRILGIDPGLTITGYACVECASRRDEPALIEAGVFRFRKGASIAARVRQLHGDLTGVIEELQPTVMAVEKLFTHPRHPRTSVIMAHARGVVLLAGEAAGLTLLELGATEVKKSITGNGHASKEQMQRAVMGVCRLPTLPTPPDVADAIGIAWCAAGRRIEAPTI